MRQKNTFVVFFFVTALVLLTSIGHSQAQTWHWAARTEPNPGSISGKYIYDTALDQAGNLYVTGRYQGATRFGSTVISGTNSWSAFVAKLSSSGQWVWALSLGSGIFEEGSSIAVDATGQKVYVAGTLSSGTYMLGPSTVTIPSGVCTHGAFLGQLSASTGEWQWAYGANNGSGIRGMALGKGGSINVTGYCKGTDFAVGNAVAAGTLAEGTLFVARYDAAGQAQWMTTAYVGGLYGQAYSIALDPADNVYITGGYEGNVQLGSSSFTSVGRTDVLVAKLNAAGAWQWGVGFGGSNYEVGNSIVADAAGNTYIATTAEGAVNVGTTAFPSVGGRYAVVAKCDPNGQWAWAVRPSGSRHGATTVALDGAGRLYVKGFMGDVAGF